MDEDLPETNEPTVEHVNNEDYKFDQHQPPQQPLEESIVMLRANRNDSEVEPKPQKQNRPSLQELQRALKQLYSCSNSRHLEIAGKRQTMSLKRAELKNLSLQVEQELQKALLTRNKHATLNVSDFFSREGSTLQSENPRIGNTESNVAQLQVELKQVRQQQEKAKKELARVKHEQQTRSFGVDHEKFTEVKNRLKNRLEEIEALSHDKQTLQKEVDMLNESVESLNIKEAEQLTQKHITIKSELLREVKTSKTQLNDIEREDRSNTEKIKFLLEASSYSETMRRKNQSMDANAGRTTRAKLGKDMNDIAQEISEMLEEKYHVEGSIKQQLDYLKTETDRLEKQNWATINKLREYDAYLLNYYNAVKAHKRSINATKRQVSMSREDRQEKSDRNSAKQNSQSMLVREDAIVDVTPTPPITEVVEEDMLLQVGPKADAFTISVEDFVENATMEELTVHYLNNILVGIEAQYSSPEFSRLAGAKIFSVPRNKQTQSQSFNTSGMHFQSIEVGYLDNTDTIGYVKIIESQGETALLWGNPKDLKIECKTFPNQYKSINLAGHLRQEECTPLQ